MSPSTLDACELPVHAPSESQQRLRSLNLTMLLPPIVVGGVLIVLRDAQTWWHGVVLALGVAAAVVAFVQWARGRLMTVLVPCLVVAAGVWVFGVLVADSRSAFFGVAVVGPLAVPQLSGHRRTAAVALALFVLAAGSARLLVSREDVRDELLWYAAVPTGLVVILTGLMFPNKRFYDVVADLERSRERDAELAVTRERVRFASDLHDIQGHTLHVVKLKVALAQKLVHTDTARVEQELREIHELVGDTITQTKELAYAQRRLNLSAELENAKNLFEAAGIDVRVRREAENGPETRTSELLGQVLRETTTNILRHAQASTVQITSSERGITIVNDGAPARPARPLRGLSALGQRVDEEGGELTVFSDDGRFVTSATFPDDRGPATPISATEGA